MTKLSIDCFVESFCSHGTNRSLILEDPGGNISPVRVNEHSIHAPASLSKLLVAIAAVEVGPDLSTPVSPDRLVKSHFPAISNVLSPDTQLTLGQLLMYSIATSDNPSADLLLREVGRTYVYGVAVALGLAYPYSPAGFQDSMFDSMYEEQTTASDVAKVLMHIHELRGKQGYNLIWNSMLNNQRNQRISGDLPDEISVAHKTGTLDGVYHDAGFVLLPYADLLLVMMSSGEDTESSTNRDIADTARSIVSVLDHENGIVRRKVTHV
jgi:beta-lactamase class A